MLVSHYILSSHEIVQYVQIKLMFLACSKVTEEFDFFLLENGIFLVLLSPIFFLFYCWVVFVTAAPSARPTVAPTGVPTSTVPTAAPSITGAVVFVETNKPVTESLSDSDVQEIITLAENTFGVYPGNVEADVSYDITGTIVVSSDDDVSDEELASALQSSIANALSVHESDVEVVIDPETGVATYTISSASAEDATALQDALQETSTNDAITSGVSTTLPSVTDVTRNKKVGFTNIKFNLGNYFFGAIDLFKRFCIMVYNY